MVALTANALVGDREQCLAAGMDDYLSKPFTAAQVNEVLGRWLPRREQILGTAAQPQRLAGGGNVGVGGCT